VEGLHVDDGKGFKDSDAFLYGETFQTGLV